MKSYTIPVLLIIFFPFFLSASEIKGKITDDAGNALPFVNIYIKGTSIGTTSNLEGSYSLNVKNGEYTVIFQYIGYKTVSERISVSDIPVVLNVILFKESISLKEVVVSSDAEDPAYRIIRNAIEKRKSYLEEVNSYTCNVYIKGYQRVNEHPDKFMGFKITNEDLGIIDTASNIVYLSESMTKFHYMKPDHIKEEMISSSVSGDNKSFSYNMASDALFNFYENYIFIEELSEKSFISPIASNALFFYKYRFAGTFIENGLLVNKIEVIPKRKSDPVFSGNMYIVEDSWRIHSVDLLLTKDAQIDFVDTLIINQVHIPVEEGGAWLPFSNKFVFFFRLMGFKGSGMYLGVNSEYILDPDFPKNFFSGEVLKIEEDANKKDSSYWEESRPVPLTIEEKEDYRIRDSLQKIKESKPYLDSLDKANNKFKLRHLLFGYNYFQRSAEQTWFVSAPIENVQYNTVQGLVLGLDISFSKKFPRRKRIKAGSFISYGFADKRWNGGLNFKHNFQPQRFAYYELSGGLNTVQFNSKEAVTPLVNSAYTLLREENYMKLYEKSFGGFKAKGELFNGLMCWGTLTYEERKPLRNYSDFKFLNRTEIDFTSNDPLFPFNDSLFSFTNHQSFNVTLDMRIKFKQRYYTRPYEKVLLESKFPVLLLTYKKGIKNFFGTDTDFDLLKLSCEGFFDFKLIGKSRYNVTAGKFLNNKTLPFMDYYHINGNQTIVSNFSFTGFHLLPYYIYSTNKEFFEGHFRHNFNSFFLSKIPLFKKAMLNEIIGVNYISAPSIPNYVEFFAGVEKLGIFRIDFVTGFAGGNKISSGIRIGIQAGDSNRVEVDY